jgi:hypothetical protein
MRGIYLLAEKPFASQGVCRLELVSKEGKKTEI